MTPTFQTSRTYPPSASALAFPLGGIGTGNVSLGARGELRDWEIFNRPAKGNTLPNTFFALWARAGHESPVAKVLEAPLPAPHIGSHGYHPLTAAGLPRLAGAEFRGEYPFATVTFDDPDLPLDVELTAYTPLIPLNPAPGIPFERPSDERVNRSAEILADRHMTVSVRKSRGRDIRAACGQLIVEGGTKKSAAQQMALLLR